MTARLVWNTPIIFSASSLIRFVLSPKETKLSPKPWNLSTICSVSLDWVSIALAISVLVVVVSATETAVCFAEASSSLVLVFKT
ncbi:hypothetical protein D3C75_1076900 [compost metagenome]